MKLFHKPLAKIVACDRFRAVVDDVYFPDGVIAGLAAERFNRRYIVESGFKQNAVLQTLNRISDAIAKESDAAAEVVFVIKDRVALNLVDVINFDRLCEPTTEIVAALDLIMPNGRSIALERQPGANTAGYAGLEDEDDNHWSALYQGRPPIDIAQRRKRTWIYLRRWRQ